MSKNELEMPYRNVPTSGDPRKTEAWALTEAARRMKAAQEKPNDIQAFLETLRLNWRLWTIFQAELSSPESPVPIGIRENMLSLCNYVDRVTVDMIADGELAKVEQATSLININRELARGLLGMATDEKKPTSQDNLTVEPSMGSSDTESFDKKI